MIRFASASLAPASDPAITCATSSAPRVGTG
jgi:hypothetical protein